MPRARTHPSLEVEVTSNAPELAKAFAKLAEEQLPFATAVALTRVAQDSRDDARKQLGRTFTLRSRRRVEMGIQINRAEKRDYPNCKAEVGLKDEFMADHVVGRERKPKPGTGHLAIPTRLVERGPAGGVVLRHKPRTIRRTQGGFVTDAKGQPTGDKSPAGDAMIRRRVDALLERRQKVEGFGKRRRRRSRLADLEVATFFLLRERVKIDPKWPFPQQVRSTVADRYPVHFRTEYEAAMRSARANAAKLSADAGRFFYLRARRQLGGRAFPLP